jgi:CDP-diacylglycerol--glycerol-3-phosphate 3-phosphatidyltransferase
MPTLYDLKPAFQAKLRPLVGRLATAGVTANQVTLLAAVLSVAAGAIVFLFGDHRPLWLLLPVVLFLRMALNAIDGMLAREHRQASQLGMYLNELCDVVSDLALILAFLAVSAFAPWGIVAFAVTAILAEFAGVLAVAIGAPRNYAGPLGKSDRALALGIIAVLVAFNLGIGLLAAWIFPALTILSLATMVHRVRAGLASAR